MSTKNNEKWIYKLTNHLLNILFIIISIIIIIGVYYIVQIKVFKNDYANIFGFTFFEVGTGSMSPAIEIGDIVFVKITKEVNENDIIVYKEGKNFITHRIVKKEGESLVAKGDANNSEDKPIQLNDVLGEVTYIIPKVGVWREIILTPKILSLIIMVIIIFGITFIYMPKSGEKND